MFMQLTAHNVNSLINNLLCNTPRVCCCLQSDRSRREVLTSLGVSKWAQALVIMRAVRTFERWVSHPQERAEQLRYCPPLVSVHAAGVCPPSTAVMGGR